MSTDHTTTHHVPQSNPPPTDHRYTELVVVVQFPISNKQTNKNSTTTNYPVALIVSYYRIDDWRSVCQKIREPSWLTTTWAGSPHWYYNRCCFGASFSKVEKRFSHQKKGMRFGLDEQEDRDFNCFRLRLRLRLGIRIRIRIRNREKKKQYLHGSGGYGYGFRWLRLQCCFWKNRRVLYSSQLMFSHET